MSSLSAENENENKNKEFLNYLLHEPIEDELIHPQDIIERINKNASLFVNGDLAWSSKKNRIIIRMAEDFETLSKSGIAEYRCNKWEICPKVCEKLSEAGASEASFRWVNHVLSPLGYTNQSFTKKSIYLSTDPPGSSSSKSVKVNSIDLEELERLDPESIKNEYLRFLEDVKESKRRIREDREKFESVLQKYDIPVKIEKELLTEDPPEEYWGDSLTYQRIGSIYKQMARVTQILKHYCEETYKFKPDPVLDKRVAEELKPLDELFMPMWIKFWSGYTDDKEIETWFGWLQCVLSFYYSGQNASAARKALSTGEFIYKSGDSEKIIELTRKATHEHLKTKIPEMIKEIPKSLLFNWMLKGFEDLIRNQLIIHGENKDEVKAIEQAIKSQKTNR